MGREVRRVPEGWEHPRNDRGDFRPLYDEDYEFCAQAWLADCAAWEAGTHESQQKGRLYANECAHFWEYESGPPDPDYYRPAWAEEERTHYQLYETVTEGTPVSPPFRSKETLIQYLCQDGDFQGTRRTLEQATSLVEGGWAPSMIVTRQPDGTIDIETP